MTLYHPLTRTNRKSQIALLLSSAANVCTLRQKDITPDVDLTETDTDITPEVGLTEADTDITTPEVDLTEADTDIIPEVSLT